MSKIKSIKLNMLINALKGLMSVVFPLITFPYITKTIGVDNVGKYSFSHSVISYFVLLSGLGINTYAIREGARLREEKDRLSLFANQMLSINMCAVFFSYILFFICLFSVSKFQEYRSILLILSVQILFNSLGVEWIYSIFEDFLYITIRSFVLQLISLLLMFIFVKDKNDVNAYAIIVVLSSVGANLYNLLKSSKYCKLRITRRLNLSVHFKPIIIIFSMTLAISIYVSSDITMLGFLCNDYIVGIYSVSTKVYGIIKTILSAILVTSIPRLSSLLHKDNKIEFEKVATDVYKILLTVLIPSIVGIIALRKEIVQLISSEEYLSATTSLLILSVALFFCLGAWFWGQCVLMPLKCEKDVFNATIISAVVNIVLNLVLIPIGKENAAAFTTVIAEAIAFIICWYKGKKYVTIKIPYSELVSIMTGCIVIYIIVFVMRKLILDVINRTIITIISALFVYIIIEIFMKNEVISDIYYSIRTKLKM